MVLKTCYSKELILLSFITILINKSRKLSYIYKGCVITIHNEYILLLSYYIIVDNERYGTEKYIDKRTLSYIYTVGTR